MLGIVGINARHEQITGYQAINIIAGSNENLALKMLERSAVKTACCVLMGASFSDEASLPDSIDTGTPRLMIDVSSDRNRSKALSFMAGFAFMT